MANQIPSLVARTSAQAANTATTPSITSTGATLLVAVIGIQDTKAPAAISDSKSNTWTGLTAKTFATNQTTQIFYVANPTVGTSHTFTVTGTSIFFAMTVYAFSGVVTTSPFDQQNGGTSTSSTALSTGNITPSVNGSLIVTGFGSGANLSTLGYVAVDSDVASIFSQGDGVWNNSSNYYGSWAAWGVQTTAAAIHATWSTFGGSGVNANGTAVIASFKPATATGGGGTTGFASA